METSTETTGKKAGKRTAKVRAVAAGESKPSVVNKSASTSTIAKSSAKTTKQKTTKTLVAEPAASSKVAVKPRVKKAAPKKIEQQPVAVAHSEAELRHMIAVAAYFMAEKRHFTPGDEWQDWLIAEQQIRSQYQHA